MSRFSGALLSGAFAVTVLAAGPHTGPAGALAPTPAPAVFTAKATGSTTSPAGGLMETLLSWMGSSFDQTLPPSPEEDHPSGPGGGVPSTPYDHLAGYPGRNPRTIKEQTQLMRDEQQIRAVDFWAVGDRVVRVNVVTGGCDDVRGWVEKTADTVLFGVIGGLPVDGNPEGICTEQLVFSTIDIAVPGGISGRTIKETTIPANVFSR